MGDRSKLKTGNLGVNAMEEKRLNKYLNTLEKQTRDKVINTERQQKVMAKHFHKRLDKSAALARKQENIALSFKMPVNRCYSSKSKVDKGIHLINSQPEEPKLSESRNSPSLLLREWNQSFDVPYLKEYSFSWYPDTKPSSVMEMRCKMWQKISEFCLNGRERARSAPPWLRDLRAPAQVQRAHLKTLEVMRIQKSLVQSPSRQPVIDLQSVRTWREKEKKIACCAVKEFVKTIVPYKLRPGPSQQVHDINSFYRLLSTSEPPLKSFCCSS
ncbi:uncharacterized protein LOC116294742 [Actinia tenebrosa]|uniref:Uncharacterized protein LOC116294742 n=1 Tax=Actinia tenebrosa TaxID=6105 RepID=A0A6P8HPD6_ACTTE|nr:uncharacterized protein LOC116294742 [Actinia tenebrosa]